MFWTRFVTVNLSQCYTNQRKRRRYLGAKLSKSLFFLKNNDFQDIVFQCKKDTFVKIEHFSKKNDFLRAKKISFFSTKT